MFPFVLELFRSTAYREHKIIQQSRPRKKLSEFCKKSLFIRQRNLNLNTMKSGILLMGNPRLKRKSDSVILTQDKQIDEMKGKRGEFQSILKKIAQYQTLRNKTTFELCRESQKAIHKLLNFSLAQSLGRVQLANSSRAIN